MSAFNKATWCLALIVVVGLGVSSASAALSDYASSAYAVGTPEGYSSWAGSFYVDEWYYGYHLVGNLDWAVFDATTFSTLFPDNHPGPGADYAPNKALVYTYQIHNGNSTTPITLHQVYIQDDAPVDNAGWFAHTASPVVNGQEPFSSSINLPFVTWDFQSPCNIDPNEDSVGLAFCSDRAPTMGFNITVDSSFSTFEITGVPGPASIPEPSSAVLLATAAAVMGMAIVRRQRRK
jgi:hypothetical protein